MNPVTAMVVHEALPGLETELPSAGLARLPTPIDEVRVDGRVLWIKRDDLSDPRYGGNKVRKLDLILAAAMRDGCRRIVTFGATGTHHGLATALFCQALGLNCEVLLFDQPDTPHVRDNLRRLGEAGARRVHCGSLSMTLLRYALHPGRLRRDTRFVFAGGSDPLGTLAFVNAALELAAQVRAGECPAPSRIYCALGSGSTLAGLTLGVALAGLPSEVIGVRVADARLGPFDACSERTVAALMARTLRWLAQRGIDWPAGLPTPRIDHGWIGAGYGHVTESGLQATAVLADAAGLALDATYTAKAAAAALADRRAGPVLYWHTLGH